MDVVLFCYSPFFLDRMRVVYHCSSVSSASHSFYRLCRSFMYILLFFLCFRFIILRVSSAVCSLFFSLCFVRVPYPLSFYHQVGFGYSESSRIASLYSRHNLCRARLKVVLFCLLLFDLFPSRHQICPLRDTFGKSEKGAQMVVVGP